MNNIRFVEQFCPVCSDGNEIPVDIASDIWYGRGGWFPIVRCKSCRIVYTKIIPDRSSVGSYYPSTYDHYNVTHVAPNKISHNFWTRYLGSRRLPLPPPASVFEIGASNGAFLSYLLSLGYDACGLEPSAEKMSYPSDLSTRITCGSFDRDYIFEKRYNMVVAWMVLEHLYDPLNCCRIIKSALTDRGVFVGSVPVMSCLGRFFFGRHWYGYQVPTHFTHFDVKSLERLLLKSGFRVVSVSYQANCMNLLRSMEYYFRSKNLSRAAFLVSKIIRSRKFGKFRAVLSAVLKAARLSGRIEFVAYP